MNRYELALDAVKHPATLLDLAHNFTACIEEALSENKDANTDPAVTLIGMKIGFLLHSDIATGFMYDKLVAACRTNRVAPVTPVGAPPGAVDPQAAATAGDAGGRVFGRRRSIGHAGPAGPDAQPGRRL